VNSFIVTCEHASPHIPENCPALPEGLPEHRIYDRGAAESAERFAEKNSAKLFSFKVSRMLIDANRSITNRYVFSKYAHSLPENIRLKALIDHYIPFRTAVYDAINETDRAIHLSFHSYTPELYDKVRDYEIGILYDPARSPEKDIAGGLIKYIKAKSGLRVRANKPYKGNADGHTTSLRKQFAPVKYSGIEIEFNQALTTDEMLNLTDLISAYF